MFNDRKLVFKALVGSRNYNLNDETSDKDWKYFILPTFDDLYTGKYFSTSKVGTEEDYDAHDIRKLGDLFWKANVNFLEVLYSNEIDNPMKITQVYGQCHYETTYKYPELQSIFDMRDSIVTMNLPYLYSACKGMYHEKIKRLTKGTEGTQHLVDKFGYDTKQALHAFRILDFIVRFHEFNWDFKEAMTYNDVERALMLRIKHGEFTLEDFMDLVSDAYSGLFTTLEEVYKSQQPNVATKDKLDGLIKEMVRRNI